jgi:Zn2+/Cd2+-exporting ATPase
VDKSEGDDVFAGTINGEGALTVETTKAAGDRTLDRIITLVEEAQTQKAPTQVFTDRFERVFVPAVLIADILVMVVPPLLGVWDWSTSVYRGMALLVAASPCALALGTPATVLAGIAQAARRGVLVKGGMHLENLGTIKAIALDKTGTLTVGQPEVTDVVPAADVTAGELLRIAAAVEQQSQHPLAAAVVRKAHAEGIPIDAAEAVESVTGRGIRANVGGRRVEIGNARLFNEANVTSRRRFSSPLRAFRPAAAASCSLVRMNNGSVC